MQLTRITEDLQNQEDCQLVVSINLMYLKVEVMLLGQVICT
nr:MAG TPA: hypothetical protein [Caudoviricetes sp.]